MPPPARPRLVFGPDLVEGLGPFRRGRFNVGCGGWFGHGHASSLPGPPSVLWSKEPGVRALEPESKEDGLREPPRSTRFRNGLLSFAPSGRPTGPRRAQTCPPVRSSEKWGHWA